MLNLIDTAERLKYTGDGFTIMFRRIPAGVRARIIRENTQRGVPDMGAATQALLRWCIVDWDGVLLNGEKVDCTPERVDLIPDAVGAEVLERANSTVRLEDELGN